MAAIPTSDGTNGRRSFTGQSTCFKKKKALCGALANVAVCIARLGGSSTFIGKVGEDEFGHVLATILKQNKVNNFGMRFEPNARTALTFVTLRADGKDFPLWSAHLDALAIAKKSGCLLSYDPNLRLLLWPSEDAARNACSPDVSKYGSRTLKRGYVDSSEFLKIFIGYEPKDSLWSVVQIWPKCCHSSNWKFRFVSVIGE
ncbi:hypothetical protein HYC85_014005 [Camellia sinensis]|uniref:Carbohydrate kinase PfkB domain-containing protein n=1 Tax=Camellia sinensis TaxID=4442 RepID=A0A7J7H8H0_CAMSI|nr:hypothetical protein HYC85_014005 [Camellia sinensis]